MDRRKCRSGSCVRSCARVIDKLSIWACRCRRPCPEEFGSNNVQGSPDSPDANPGSKGILIDGSSWIRTTTATDVISSVDSDYHHLLPSSMPILPADADAPPRVSSAAILRDTSMDSSRTFANLTPFLNDLDVPAEDENEAFDDGRGSDDAVDRAWTSNVLYEDNSSHGIARQELGLTSDLFDLDTLSSKNKDDIIGETRPLSAALSLPQTNWHHSPSCLRRWHTHGYRKRRPLRWSNLLAVPECSVV
eukprot:TRINITY_DN50167_c0_g1_i1.p1 TRINITY_DN50167_c0_g1~~TRINITY_DN50167_c0_g1_i1.p1  ORF type:complete len:267 (+),score=28.99 TRINITY_DN50167_c0_g1_i1:58-801(+)